MAGFAAYRQTGLLLQADQTVTANITLIMAAAGQTITVEAAAATVDTSTSTLNEVVDEHRVVELPLNGRNAASLTLITAGTVLAPASADEGSTKTFPVDVTISANGSRQNQTSFRLDGANNNDIYTNVNQPFPFPDAVQEFSVQTSNYSARYGGNAGGVVNVVTKSGTNELHGDAFEFVRNSVFNARNYFAKTRDQLKRNQFGGVLGGPVTIPKVYDGRNKTFFFFGYQGTRIRNTGNGQSSYVPTQANIDGDFSALLSATNPNNPLGKVMKITDPTTGQQFPGNIIPAYRLDKAALALTKYLPGSTTNGLVFYGAPVSQDFDETTVRGDHSFSDRDHLSVRYFYDRYNNAAYLDPKNYLNNSAFAVIPAHNAMVSETHTFSPTMLNDLRVSFGRETAVRGPAPGSIDVGALGVNIFQPPGDQIIESLSVSGYFSISQTEPATFARNQYGVADTFGWVHGQHSMSFGVEAMRGQVIIRNQFHEPGQFSFTADYNGDAMAAFLLGGLRTFVQGNGEFKDNLLDTYSLFFEDSYHVTRRLTLNLGLRFDPFYPWHENRGRTEIFSVAAYQAGVTSSQFVNAPKGLLFPGDAGVPEYGLRANLKDFAPRIGFAWDVLGDGKTSVRGGVGVFYDSIQNGIYNNRFVDTTPFSVQVNVTSPKGTFSNPYAGMANPFPAPYPPPSNIVFPSPAQVVSYDPSHDYIYPTPVVYGYNLTVEHQFKGDWLGRIAYVGSQSRHLLESQELSPSVYIAGSKLSADQRRYFPGYGSIAMASQDINSNYNSLQITAEKNLSKGFTVLANYTWSKSMDDLPFGQSVTTVGTSNAGGSSLASPIPWYMPGRHQFDTGPSEFDHTQRFVASFLWYIPGFNNAPAFVKYALGGWQLTGLFNAQTGSPLTVLAGKDESGTALNADRGYYVGGDPYGSTACGTTAPCVSWLNPSAFVLPAAGTYGNAGKGALRGPGLEDYDGGLFKELPLRSERYRLEFRAEFFNLLNHANFFNPGLSASDTTGNGIVAKGPTVSAAGFGTIKAAYDPRIGQLALKLFF